jgi:hypothetical protein
MNRNLASALALAITAAAAVAAAAIASGRAYADDITTDNTRLTSSRSRADVQAELKGQRAALQERNDEWTRQLNQLPTLKSSYTSQEAKAEFKVSRDLVNALNAEDSGSAYFTKSPLPVNANVMGSPRAPDLEAE